MQRLGTDNGMMRMIKEPTMQAQRVVWSDKFFVIWQAIVGQGAYNLWDGMRWVG